MPSVSFAIHKAAMFIADVGKEMCVHSRDEYRHGDAFDGCIAPSVVIDAARPVDVVDVALVVGGEPQRHGRYLKVVVEQVRVPPLVEELRRDIRGV